MKETIDSDGKNVPSATPEESSSYDSGAGLTNGDAPSSLADASEMPPPVRILSPAEVGDRGHLLLDREHLARAVREHAEQLDALVFVGGLEVLPVNARERDRVDLGGGAGAGQLGISGSGWRAGV